LSLGKSERLRAFTGCVNNNLKNIHTMQHKLNFKTQYNQFYISSDNAKSLTTVSEWDEEAYKERLGIFKNLLIVHTESYGSIKGEIVFLKEKNESFNYDLYDHIVEGNIEILSGRIQILDCPNSLVELEIPIKSGKYRVRVYSMNLSSVEGEEGDDYYKIEIWESSETGIKVLKIFPR
jgi:hypothetical protein